MRRSCSIPLLLVIALACASAACDSPDAADVATAQSVANTAVPRAERTFPPDILAAVAAASPSLHADRETATAITTPYASPRAVPTVAVSQAVMVAAAVAHLRGREAIVSGQPEVLLATPGSAASMETLGLDVGHPDPTGRHPLYLVIVAAVICAAGAASSRRAMPAMRRSWRAAAMSAFCGEAMERPATSPVCWHVVMARLCVQ